MHNWSVHLALAVAAEFIGPYMYKTWREKRKVVVKEEEKETEEEEKGEEDKE